MEAPKIRPRERPVCTVPGRTEINRRQVVDVVARQTTVEVWLGPSALGACLLVLTKAQAERLAGNLQRAAAHLGRNERVVESDPGVYGEVAT